MPTATESTANEPENGYKATILTWNTKPGDAKLSNVKRMILHGERESHSAIMLTFPVNERGTALITQYCNGEPNLPYTLKTQPGTDQQYYEVFFSGGMGFTEEGKVIYELRTYNEEASKQRLFVNVPVPAGANPDDFSKRKAPFGLLTGRPIITLGHAITIKPPVESTPNYESLMEDLTLYKDTYNTLKKIEDDWLHSYTQFRKSGMADADINELPKIIELNTKQNELATKEKTIAADFKNKFKQNITDYIVTGKQPDFTIDLALKDSKDGIGLNLEDMLIKMREIADNQEPFSPYGKNCSATVLAIINNGISEQDKPWMAKDIGQVTANFKDKNAWIFRLFTPQSVHNSAVQLKQNLTEHNKESNPISTTTAPTAIPFKIFYAVLKTIKNFFKKQRSLHRPKSLTFTTELSKTTATNNHQDPVPPTDPNNTTPKL